LLDLDPGDVLAVPEARLQVDVHLHFTLQALDDPDDVVLGPARRHEVDDPRPPHTSSLAKQASESMRGRHSQSIDPNREISATVVASPMSP